MPAPLPAAVIALVSAALALPAAAVPATAVGVGVGDAAVGQRRVVPAALSMSWSTANSVATGDQDNPSIASNRYGQAAVVWEDDRETADASDNAHTDIFVRLYTDGVSTYEKKLSPGGVAGTSWRHLSPDVSLDDQGNAVVVWAEDADGNGYYNISYRVLSATGAVRASGQAHASATGDQILPRVAADPDGPPGDPSAVAFTVVWQDIQGSAAPTIRAAGYTSTGTRAYEVTASQSTGTHRRPDVAVGAGGDALVVWDEDADGNGYDNIGLVRLARATGAVSGSRRVANSMVTGQQRHPTVAADFAGAAVVCWESDHTGTQGVWARSFTADGTARHAEVELSTGDGTPSAPSAGIDDQGNVAVGWSLQADTADVWVGGLNPDGSTAGRLAAQRTGQTATGRQEQLVVAVSPWGEVALAYTDDNDGNTFDQIILGQGGVNGDWPFGTGTRQRALLGH